jgi:hypothetical protein
MNHSFFVFFDSCFSVFTVQRECSPTDTIRDQDKTKKLGQPIHGQCVKTKKLGQPIHGTCPVGMRYTLIWHQGGTSASLISWLWPPVHHFTVARPRPLSRFRYTTVCEKILFRFSRHFHNSQSRYHSSSSPICKINGHMFQGSPGSPCSQGPARSPVGPKWQPTDHVNVLIMRYFCVFISNWIKKSRRPRANNVTLKLWRVREDDKPL